MNAAFEEFGLARTLAAFDGPPCYGPVACIDRLLAAVDAFTGGTPQSDDITCIALSHRPAA
jgi:serine phosphatase RsbU (regulator of sigma subunit)